MKTLSEGMTIQFGTNVDGITGLEIVSHPNDVDYVIARVIRADTQTDAVPSDTEVDSVVSLSAYRNSGKVRPPEVLEKVETIDAPPEDAEDVALAKRVQTLIAEANSESNVIDSINSSLKVVGNWVKFIALTGVGIFMVFFISNMATTFYDALIN